MLEHCIGRDWQTIRYIAAYYESWGETLAFRMRSKPERARRFTSMNSIAKDPRSCALTTSEARPKVAENRLTNSAWRLTRYFRDDALLLGARLISTDRGSPPLRFTKSSDGAMLANASRRNGGDSEKPKGRTIDCERTFVTSSIRGFALKIFYTGGAALIGHACVRPLNDRLEAVRGAMGEACTTSPEPIALLKVVYRQQPSSSQCAGAPGKRFSRRLQDFPIPSTTA
jgi:hypothetical protein